MVYWEKRRNYVKSNEDNWLATRKEIFFEPCLDLNLSFVV